jgi:hypothetical protein
MILLLAGIAILPLMGKIYLEIPFSKPIEESNQRVSFDKFLLSLAIVAILAILHFYSYIIPMGRWIYVSVLTAGIPISWKFATPGE